MLVDTHGHVIVSSIALTLGPKIICYIVVLKVLKELNRHIKQLCNGHGLSYIETELNAQLFSSSYNGLRKNTYFRSGYDNVHLNKVGITRLGRHLKHFAHNS